MTKEYNFTVGLIVKKGTKMAATDLGPDHELLMMSGCSEVNFWGCKLKDLMIIDNKCNTLGFRRSVDICGPVQLEPSSIKDIYSVVVGEQVFVNEDGKLVPKE